MLPPEAYHNGGEGGGRMKTLHRHQKCSRFKGFHKEYRDAQINRLNKWHCFKIYTAIIDVTVADSYRAVVVIARQSSKTYDISAGACGHDQETKGMFEKFFHRKWITL